MIINLASIRRSPPRLIDGPLIFAGSRRELVERMAADLIRFDAWHDEHEAIRSLYGHGYPMVDIVMLIDDARQVAQTSVVAEAMSQP
jgi:hypothetical protein